MIVYFDECYDGNHDFLILGALFNPNPKTIHKKLVKSKRDQGYVDSTGNVREIKYAECYTFDRLKIAKMGIDCFISSTSWFRAIVIDQRDKNSYDLDYFGKPGEPKIIKEARAYKKFAELLLKSNVSNISNAVLLTDRLTRCKGDIFPELIGSNVTIYFDRNYDGIQDGSLIIEVGQGLDEFNSTLKTVDDLDIDNNAVDAAFIKLLDYLNFIEMPFNSGLSGSETNPIDIELSEDMTIETLFISGIPYMWGPVDIGIEVWV